MFRALLLTTVLFIAGESLKCHVVPTGNLSVADTSQPQECGIGSLACLKVVDFTRGTYTKQCQTTNCTMNGLPNAVANCANTTSFGVSAATCCCYGDGCNAAPQTATFTAIGIAVLAIATLHWVA